MRPTKYNKSKKPQAFISNLYKLIQDQSNDQYIKWRDDGESFIILNICKFSEHILPRYFKHSNYASFVRQLNMYNFTKLRTQMEGEHVFKNQQFMRNSFENLRFIKRKEVNNNKNGSGIIALAQAINFEKCPDQKERNNKNYEKKFQNQNKVVLNVNQPSQNEGKMLQIAPAQYSPNLFQSPFLLDSFHLPQLGKLVLDPLAQQFLDETQKIPLILPLKPQTIYFPYKTKVQELKSNQLQLQQICVSLYKQNEFLTNENKRLQQKLKNQFKKKQQILNQIIKYVINFLSQWNTGSCGLDEDIQLPKDHLPKDYISEEQSSQSEIVLQSFDFLQKKRDFPGIKEKKQSTDQRGIKFTKFAKNQKKILLTLLKEIQKSYNQKFFFTQGYSTNSHQKYSHSEYGNYTQNSQFTTSPNNFMMSMLLKFIESNNLVEVIKRFSLLLNLERNKKSKNFTVVNCMKDLKQRFELKQIQRNEFKNNLMMDYQFENDSNLIRSQDLAHLHAKQKFLQNEKATIKQMQKQLALLTNSKSRSKSNQFVEKDFFESQDPQSSFLSYLTEKLQQQNKI